MADYGGNEPYLNPHWGPEQQRKIPKITYRSQVPPCSKCSRKNHPPCLSTARSNFVEDERGIEVEESSWSMAGALPFPSAMKSCYFSFPKSFFLHKFESYVASWILLYAFCNVGLVFYHAAPFYKFLYDFASNRQVCIPVLIHFILNSIVC
jgi:hypothetical protein